MGTGGGGRGDGRLPLMLTLHHCTVTAWHLCNPIQREGQHFSQ